MTAKGKRMRPVVLLFYLDMLIALLPPLHWLVSDPARTILRVPLSVWYIGLIQLAVTLTIFVAYRHDRHRAQER